MQRQVLTKKSAQSAWPGQGLIRCEAEFAGYTVVRHLTLSSAGRRMQGFTLLEMVVVLVLIGFLLAVVVPNMQRLYDSMVTASDRKALQAAINRLPLFVQERGLPYTLRQLPDTQLQHDDFNRLFDDKTARLKTAEPIFISAAGFCPFGGEVELHLQGQVYNVRLEPPRCRWP